MRIASGSIGMKFIGDWVTSSVQFETMMASLKTALQSPDCAALRHARGFSCSKYEPPHSTMSIGSMPCALKIRSIT